jgi:hypothetical protein
VPRLPRSADSVARVILSSPRVDPAELAQRTGWVIKPEGACKADRCVPLRDLHDEGDGFDAAELARRLGMAYVEDDARGLRALGPESGGRALLSAQLPDIELPDRNGRPFALRSLRGTRFVMVAWASW